MSNSSPDRTACGFLPEVPNRIHDRIRNKSHAAYIIYPGQVKWTHATITQGGKCPTSNQDLVLLPRLTLHMLGFSESVFAQDEIQARYLRCPFVRTYPLLGHIVSHRFFDYIRPIQVTHHKHSRFAIRKVYYIIHFPCSINERLRSNQRIPKAILQTGK